MACAYTAGKSRPGAQVQMFAFVIEHADRAHAVRRHAFDHVGDRLQRDAQIDVGRETLEHPPLARSQQLRAFAFGDVGDAAANQALTVRLQSHPAHFAGNIVAEAVAEHPFEHRRFARQRAIELSTIGMRRQRAVRLMRRTQAYPGCS